MTFILIGVYLLVALIVFALSMADAFDTIEWRLSALPGYRDKRRRMLILFIVASLLFGLLWPLVPIIRKVLK